MAKKIQGWLDKYASGGKMQEHQENYNDNITSIPPGFVGMGNNTKGRNYSPAWGGSFEDGGNIPQAQKGIKKKKAYTLPPIYTSDPNSKQLQAYKDSTVLNLASIPIYKGTANIKSSGSYPSGRNSYGNIAVTNYYNTYPGFNKSYERLNYPSPKDQGYNWGYFPKPVQPVILEPTSSQKLPNESTPTVTKSEVQPRPISKVIPKPQLQRVGAGEISPISLNPQMNNVDMQSRNMPQQDWQYRVESNNLQPARYFNTKKEGDAYQNSLQSIPGFTNSRGGWERRKMENGGVIPTAQQGYTKVKQKHCLSPKREVVSQGPVDEGTGGYQEPAITATPLNIQERIEYTKLGKDKKELKEYKNLVKKYAQFDVNPTQAALAISDSGRMNGPTANKIFNEQKSPATSSYDHGDFSFYAPFMPQGRKLTVPEILNIQRNQPGGISNYENFVENNYGYKKVKEQGGTVNQNFAQGGNILKAQNGLWDTNKTGYVDSVLNANKNLDWVQRMYNPNPKAVMVPGEKHPSTHLMGDNDQGYIFPQIVNMNGQLVDLGNRAEDYARETNTGIQLPKEQGTWFARSTSDKSGYKMGTGVMKGKPVMQKYKSINKHTMGGSLPGSVGFTYARTQGIPSEGKYAKKTLPSAQNGNKYSKNKNQVINQLSNFPIYSPDNRYSEYQANIQDWIPNVLNTPVEVNYNSPAQGSSYYGHGAPFYDPTFPYQGSVQLDDRQFNNIQTPDRVIGHELRHAAFDGDKFIPKWYADNLYNTARNPNQFIQGAHQNKLKERASMLIGARQNALDELGLPANSKISREAFDYWARQPLMTSLRTGRIPEQYNDVKETFEGAKNATDVHNLMNFENIPKKENGGNLSHSQKSKTIPSAQNGMAYHQQGFSWKPNSMEKGGKKKKKTPNQQATTPPTAPSYVPAIDYSKFAQPPYRQGVDNTYGAPLQKPIILTEEEKQKQLFKQAVKNQGELKKTEPFDPMDTRSIWSDSRANERGDEFYNIAKKATALGQFAPIPFIRYPSIALNTLMGTADAKFAYDEGDFTNATINAIGAIPLPGYGVIKSFKNYPGLNARQKSSILRTALLLGGIDLFGTGADLSDNFGLEQKKQGGVVKDDRGQWDHPGEITEIQGNNMATHGYGDIPLYVVPDVGRPRIVEANTGNHTFPGATKFTEYPMKKKSKGWLDKYN